MNFAWALPVEARWLSHGCACEWIEDVLNCCELFEIAGSYCELIMGDYGCEIEL